MAVLVGGRRRPLRLVRRARDVVARASPGAARVEAAARRHRARARQPAGGDRLRRDRRLSARADRLRGPRGNRKHRRQLGADLRLRHLLAGARAAQRAVRGRLPRLQPVEGDREGRGVGRPEGVTLRAAGAARLSGLARPLARRGRDLRVRRDGARRVGWRQAADARDGHARVLGADVRGDGALRRRALERSRRGVLGLLQPVLAPVADRDARWPGGTSKAALRAGSPGVSARHGARSWR